MTNLTFVGRGGPGRDDTIEMARGHEGPDTSTIMNRFGGGELPLDQVRVTRDGRSPAGRQDRLGLAGGLDPGGAHEPGDLSRPTSWPAGAAFHSLRVPYNR